VSLPLVATLWQRRIVASGTVYHRETRSGASSWVAHATWQEGGTRRQVKRSFRTKKQAQAALTDLLEAHQAGTLVAPNRMPLRDFVEPFVHSTAGRGPVAMLPAITSDIVNAATPMATLNQIMGPFLLPMFIVAGFARAAGQNGPIRFREIGDAARGPTQRGRSGCR
jgi:hypothetical protein